MTVIRATTPRPFNDFYPPESLALRAKFRPPWSAVSRENEGGRDGGERDEEVRRCVKALPRSTWMCSVNGAYVAVQSSSVVSRL